MKNKKQFFVTGISTEVGKTIASAILTEALKADYWKPIQSGDLDYSDTNKIEHLISNKTSQFHKETYRLNTPASPHYSAKVDQIEILENDFKLPKTDNHLIVEGAGGLMVPINDKKNILDLIIKFDLPIILVANYYLGSINHTLLSLEMLSHKGLDISALIFMGKPTISTREIIHKRYAHIPIIDIPHLEEISDQTILKQAIRIKGLNIFDK